MIKQVSFYDFADSWASKFNEDSRFLSDAYLELTRLCSLKCEHCYIGDARWKKDPNELSTEEWKRFLDTLADRGLLWLFFTGGEAMIRPDFRELWLYARSKGFLLVLYTNATLIDEKMGEFLELYPPVKTEVSIYGASAAVYEKVTGVKGSHNRFLRGVNEIRRRGLHWKMKVPVIQAILPEMPAIRALAEEWGVQVFPDGTIQASIGEGETGGKAPCASRVPEAELVAHELSDPNFVAEFKLNAQGCSKHAAGDDMKRLYLCGAGKDTFYMTAGGKMQACLATAHHGVDLDRSKDMNLQFDAAWTEFGKLQEMKRDPASPCYDCDIQILCQTCPGMAHLEHGDEHGSIEWICRRTHLKAHQLGVPHKCKITHPLYREN